MKQTDVQETVERAAQAVATLSPEQWPGWVIYFLEVLDATLNVADWRAAEYCHDAQRRLLSAVKDSIETRLDVGRW